MFYPGTPEQARAAVAAMLQAASESLPGDGYFAGLAPHAGWAYSGPAAAKTFAALAASGTPGSVVLLGAVHSWGVTRAALYPCGAWDTPLGPLVVDEELAAGIAREGPG